MKILMPVKKLFPLLILLSALSGMVLPGLAAAEDILAAPWQITADRITHEKETEHIIAEGNVVLRQQEPAGAGALEVKADWIQYETRRGTITARGNINIHSGDEVITAEETRLDLNRQTGTILKTTLFLPDSNLYFSGDVVEKTGDLTYRLQDGWVTACPAEEGKAPAWSIKAADTELTLEGYAVLKNAVFRVKDVPIAYSPYLVLPAKTIRETGVLFPEFSQSARNGTGLLAPFFINLSPSSDFTLYPGYLSERGVVAGIEYRYVADKNSRGTFSYTHLDDSKDEKTGDEYKSDGYRRLNRNRYWLKGKADHAFGNDLVARLDLDVVSDRDYIQEYRKGIIGFDKANAEYVDIFHRGFQEETLPFRESKLQLAKAWSSMFAGVEMLAIKDVRDEPSATTPVQTLPRMQFSGRTPLGGVPFPVTFVWDADYVNYWRDEGYGAHRVDLFPRLTTPLPLSNVFEGLISAGLRETYYHVETYGDSTSQWLRDDSPSRRVWDFSADIAYPLARDFSLAVGPFEKISHLLRPTLRYSFVPSVDQDNLPDLDTNDRIEQENWFSYGLHNYFKVSDAGRGVIRKFGYFKVDQTVDVKEERRTLSGAADKSRPYSDVLFEFELYPFERLTVRYETAVSVHGAGTTYYHFAARHDNLNGDILSLDYRYKRNPEAIEPYFYDEVGNDSLHELNFALKRILSEQIAIQGDIAQSLSKDRTVETTLRLLYTPSCWSMEILASKTPDDKRIAFIFSLAGLGKVMGLGTDL